MSSEVKRENSFYVDSDKLSKEALEKKHRLENDPSVRTRLLGFPHNWEQEPLWR